MKTHAMTLVERKILPNEMETAFEAFLIRVKENWNQLPNKIRTPQESLLYFFEYLLERIGPIIGADQ